MGVAQILLDNLDLSELVIGWYKLFGTSSLVSVPPGGGKEKELAVSVAILYIYSIIIILLHIIIISFNLDLFVNNILFRRWRLNWLWRP